MDSAFEALNQDSGADARLTHVDPFDDGWLLWAEGSGNPFEDGEELSAGLGHWDETHHSSHLGRATLGGCQVLYHCLVDQPDGGGDPESRYTTVAWVGHQAGDGADHVRERHQKAVSEAVARHVRRAARLAGDLDDSLVGDVDIGPDVGRLARLVAR